MAGRPAPLFKYFSGGGIGSVRVFETGSLGQIDNTGAQIGGTRRFNVNTEFYVPMPGSGNDKTLRLFAFADAGFVRSPGQVFRDPGLRGSEDPIRASVGVGLSWISPVGPLKLIYGTPVRYLSTDRIKRFDFQIGTAF